MIFLTQNNKSCSNDNANTDEKERFLPKYESATQIYWYKFAPIWGQNS